MGPRTVILFHTGLRWSHRRHRSQISLWSRSLATEYSTKLTILGHFASNNEHCFRIFKSRISPGIQTSLMMQHLVIHHRVSMQSSQVSLYAPEFAFFFIPGTLSGRRELETNTSLWLCWRGLRGFANSSRLVRQLLHTIQYAAHRNYAKWHQQRCWAKDMTRPSYTLLWFSSLEHFGFLSATWCYAYVHVGSSVFGRVRYAAFQWLTNANRASICDN